MGRPGAERQAPRVPCRHAPFRLDVLARTESRQGRVAQAVAGRAPVAARSPRARGRAAGSAARVAGVAARNRDRRVLADQGRVRRVARALPLDRRRPGPAHRAAGDEPHDEAACVPRLVPRLRDGRRRLRHPEAEGHRALRAVAAAGAVRWLTARRACDWVMAVASTTARSRALRHALSPRAWRMRTASCRGCRPKRTTCRWTPC